MRKRWEAFGNAHRRFDADRQKLLKGIPEHWVAMGPDGMITHMPVMRRPDGSPDHQGTIKAIISRVKKIEGDDAEYHLGYLDPHP